MYPDGHPINPKKINDLQRMFLFLPMEHHQFYANLQSYPMSDVLDMEYDTYAWLSCVTVLLHSDSAVQIVLAYYEFVSTSLYKANVRMHVFLPKRLILF